MRLLVDFCCSKQTSNSRTAILPSTIDCIIWSLRELLQANRLQTAQYEAILCSRGEQPVWIEFMCPHCWSPFQTDCVILFRILLKQRPAVVWRPTAVSSSTRVMLVSRSAADKRRQRLDATVSRGHQRKRHANVSWVIFTRRIIVCITTDF